MFVVELLKAPCTGIPHFDKERDLHMQTSPVCHASTVYGLKGDLCGF